MRDSYEFEERLAILENDGHIPPQMVDVYGPYVYALQLINDAGGMLELMEIAVMLKTERDAQYEWTTTPFFDTVRRKWAERQKEFELTKFSAGE